MINVKSLGRVFYSIIVTQVLNVTGIERRLNRALSLMGWNVNGKVTARYSIAVFGEWSSLLSAIESVTKLQRQHHDITVLGQSDAFADPALDRLAKKLGSQIEQCLSERIELAFEQQHPKLTCTKGPFSVYLAVAVSEGHANLREALKLWMPEIHAARIDKDLKQACLYLWCQVLEPEIEQKVSLALLNMRPMRVELRELRPIAG